eukprot:scaffold1083_cov376-Prasinococcus_capsulatus_cf.AAC.1
MRSPWPPQPQRHTGRGCCPRGAGAAVTARGASTLRGGSTEVRVVMRPHESSHTPGPPGPSRQSAPPRAGAK